MYGLSFIGDDMAIMLRFCCGIFKLDIYIYEGRSDIILLQMTDKPYACKCLTGYINLFIPE